MKGNLWGADAPSEDRPLDLVVYRSRLIGSDEDLVVWGGGNTSVKTVEQDHLGRDREVVRIKGSGTDLKSIDASGFPGVYRDEVLPLIERDAMTDEEMTAYLDRCMVEPAGRRPSIETLLHAFLPARHVDHTHADAIVTLTNSENGEVAVREALGSNVAFVRYRRPGFTLAKEVFQAAQTHDAVVLEKHGLVTWGDTAQESYKRTIALTETAQQHLDRHSLPLHAPPVVNNRTLDVAELLLQLRGSLGHVILRLDGTPRARAIVDRPDVDRIVRAGPATADHVLRIKPWPCLVDPVNPSESVEAYRARYRSFFERYAGPELQMLDPSPRVLLVPGAGIVTVGRSAAEARIVADVAMHTLGVAVRGFDVNGNYQSLSEADLFHVDYWPLELRKLDAAPAPQEFEGRVVVVTGAASGIGRAVARQLGRLGAQLALLDRDERGLEHTRALIVDAGSSEALCIGVELTEAQSVKSAFQRIVCSFGGFDGLVSNAGIGAAGKLTELTPDDWRRSMEVNATSHFLVTSEAVRMLRIQGKGGSMVFVASKNAFGPGAGFGAYSAAKAAQVQLARITAMEGGADGIRANIINPDAIFEDSGLWSAELRQERASVYGIPVDEIEHFYAQRNLLKTTICGQDVAEAAAFLLSDRARATTGTVITVDGGVAAAFPR